MVMQKIAKYCIEPMRTQSQPTKLIKARENMSNLVMIGFSFASVL